MFGLYFSALLLSLLSIVNTLSIVNNVIVIVMLLEFIAPLLNLVLLSYIVQNADSKTEQLRGTIIAGLGYASGAGISMLINQFLN